MSPNKPFGITLCMLLAFLFTTNELQATEKSSYFFQENKGQWAEPANYLSRLEQAVCTYSADGLRYTFAESKAKLPDHPIQVRFVGRNADVALAGEEKMPYYENHYLGKIEDKLEGIGSYAKLTYTEVYDAIDCSFYFNENQLKYDFILQPGACSEDIRLQYEGVASVQLDENGNLIAKTITGQLKELKPYSYQVINGQRLTVPSKYRLENQVLSFEIGNYDFDLPLVIDPVSLVWATYWSENVDDAFHDIKIDADGNRYAYGRAFKQGSNYDAVLVKFDAIGNKLWTTYFGGSGNENFDIARFYDYGHLEMDASNNLYITGKTNSTNLPILGGFQATKGGGDDAFVAKLDANGQLLLSSYLGGAGNENELGGGGISLDPSGNIFVGGSTRSTALFNTTGAYQSTYAGNQKTDAFIAKIPADFSSVTGTFWGDTTHQVIRNLAVDQAGAVWVTGRADTSGLALALGFQDSIKGRSESFLLKFNNNLSQLNWGSFIGGELEEEAYGLCVDNAGNVITTGLTYSTLEFPLASAYQQFYQGGQEGYITKVSSTGQLLWSTYFGGSKQEIVSAVTTDSNNDIYLTGITSSENFPYFHTVQATYNQFNCLHDGFVAKFTAGGDRVWASFYGGYLKDTPGGIALHNDQYVAIAGKTRSEDLPVSDGPQIVGQPRFELITSAFVANFEYACPSVPIIIHSHEKGRYYLNTFCNSVEDCNSFSIQNDSYVLKLVAPPGYANYAWRRGPIPLSGNSDATYPINPGTSDDYYEVTVNNGNDCMSASISTIDTTRRVFPLCNNAAAFNINTLPFPAEIIEEYEDVIFCSGTIQDSLHTIGFCGAEIQWQRDFVDIPGANGSGYEVTEGGCYRVSIRNTYTDQVVYSPCKKYIALSGVMIGECSNLSTPEEGCDQVGLSAVIMTCAGCEGGLPGLSYQWLEDGVPVGPVTISPGFFTEVDGNFSVEVSYDGCTFASDPVSVTVSETIRPEWTIDISEPICMAMLDSFLLAITHPEVGEDSAMVTFDFTDPYPDIIGYDSTYTILQEDNFSGCVVATVTTRAGCTSVTEFPMIIHDSLAPSLQYNSLCIPASLGVAGPPCEVDSFFWYFNGDLVREGGITGGGFSAQQPGDYYAEVKNACGRFVTDTVTVIDALQPGSLNVSGAVCAPTVIDLTLPSGLSSNYEISWYYNQTSALCSPAAIFLVQTGGTSLTATAGGYYYVRIVDITFGCSTSCSNIVEVFSDIPSAGIFPSDDIYLCDGDPFATASLTVGPTGPGFEYGWYLNNVPIPGAKNSYYEATEPGVYTAIISNPCNSANTPPVSLYVVPNPTVSLVPADTAYICGDTTFLEVISNQPVSYQWFHDGVAMTDSISNYIYADTAGNYAVNVYNEDTKCEASSTTMIVVDSCEFFLAQELLTFNASLEKDGQVRLDWKMAVERAVSHYEVDRSSNLVDWQHVNGQVSRGYSLTPQAYKSWDENPRQGLTYYRLKVVTLSGNIYYSDIRVIRQTDEGQGIYAYPNPTRGELNLRLTSERLSPSTLELLDVTGKRILLVTDIAPTEKELSLDLGDVASGVYLVKHTMRGRVAALRVVKVW